MEAAEGAEWLSGLSGEEARYVLESAATLIILEMPRGTYFGVDMRAWRTEGDFRGLKLIPPGLHYVHWAAASKETDDLSPRVGFIHNFKPREIVVKIWDTDKEDFKNEAVTDETIERLRSNLCNLDRYLAPYPFNVLQKWKDLSQHINDELVRKITPECGQIRSALDLVSCSNDDRPRGEKRTTKPSNDESTSKEHTDDSIESGKLVEQNVLPKKRNRTLTAEEKEERLLPQLKPLPGSELRFSEFPETVYPPNSTPSEITKHHLDQSYVLDLIIKTYSRPMDVVGELQFAYVSFLIGHSLEAFEYWKKLFNLFCSCEDALSKYYTVYLSFISIVEPQILEIPEEFLADIVANQNVIFLSLKKLFKTIHSADIDGRMKSAAERFQHNLSEKYMWNFGNLEVEEDDELPVIVHL